MKKQDFLEFVKTELCPKLNEKKVVIMDNLNSHTVFSEILGYGRVVHTPMEGIRVVPCNQQKDCILD